MRAALIALLFVAGFFSGFIFGIAASDQVCQEVVEFHPDREYCK